MDINRAKEIVAALAEGIDPTTGEILPEDCVCNKGDVVRALYSVLEVCAEQNVKQQKNKKEPDDYDVILYERLKVLRNKIADEKGIPSFRILPNYPLMHMAAQKPTTREEFLEIYGVGKYTARQYGKVFIAEIQNYLEETKE
jgi:superfamily II DNA helicase RecQ